MPGNQRLMNHHPHHSLYLVSSIFIFVGLVQYSYGATPVFSNPAADGSGEVSIAEDTAVATAILSGIAATDSDGGTLTYSIISQSPTPAKFILIGASTINTIDTFDYEVATDRSYVLTIEAVTDSGVGATSSVAYTVKITDVNDESPTIGGTFTGTIAEEQPVGTSIPISFTVTDADAGDVLSYLLTDTSGNFQIDSGTGAISTRQVIDYDGAATTTFSVTLTVKDSASPTPNSATQALTITLTASNDNSPVFSPNIYSVSIPENSITGTSVALLTVTDGDSDTVTLSILSGDDTAKFAVNGLQIDTASNAINYDVLSSVNYQYILTVTGSDGTNVATATVIVTITGVNENDPVWGTFSPPFTSSTTPYSLSENDAIGTTIITITATDADDGVDGQVFYSLGAITNSGGGSTSGLFNLDPVSGILTTKSQTFNRDTNNGGNEYFDIIVIATDLGTSPRSATRTIRVGLTDYNDNTPTFQQNLYTDSIPETTAGGASLVTVVATDEDETAVTLVYSIETSSTPSSYTNHFEFDGTIANQLNLKAVVDLDPPSSHDSSYTLVIKVTDGGSPELTSTAKVVVTVTSENEFTPSFPAATVTANIDEDSSSGVSVITVAATDDDEGTDGTISYVIASGNSDNKFGLDQSTGVVKVAGSLDFETTPSYTLVIHAIDKGTTAKTGIITVTVNLNDRSDEVPICTTTSVSPTVNEDEAVSFAVTTLACTDADAVDTTTFSFMSGNGEGKFNIDSTTGAITLAATLDFDAGTKYYNLVAQFSDGTNSVEIPVTVAVGAVNEHTPTFPADQDVTFAENTAFGTSLATHAATDSDASPHGIVSYDITAVTNSGTSLFMIDSSSGEITLAQSLDYETNTVYVITVVAVDGGSNTGTGSVTVQVSDVNDVTPSCTSDTYVLSLSESTASGTDVIANFGCTDADSGSLTYTITTQTYFSVDTTGTPKLKTSSALDYETLSSYTLEVTVSDGSLSTVINIVISVTDINEVGPAFPSASYTATIAENAAVGDSVTTITANDPDNDSTSFGKLLYSIISGSSNKFIIDQSSGKIIVAGVLNAEVTSTYNLVIQAIEEEGTNSATVTCVVTVTSVNDNAPTCTSALAFSVAMDEEGTASDTIMTLVCSDLDGDALTYTMTTGDTTYFVMNGAVLELLAPIDYDTVGSPQFAIIIQVSDGTNQLDVTGSVTVNGVNEATPAFSLVTYTVSKAEDTTPGSLITTVTATDADKDVGATVSFNFVTATTDFTLGESSGIILLAGSLDRETTPTYSLLVEATDGTNAVTATVALTVTDVNDNTPTFNPTSYSATVSETDAAGTTVTTVTATDNDDAATNNYGTVAFAITGGNTGSLFAITGTTGIITTTGTLDYESAETYTLYVEAKDSAGGAGAKSSTAVVTVNVGAVNEASPSLTQSTYSANVNEDSAIVSSVTQVSATDTDSGSDGDVYYSLPIPQTFFYLDTRTGDISVKASLDYEMAQSHTFEVFAHDSGTSPLSVTATISITVVDVNDNTPSCTPSLQSVTFAEDYTGTVASLACNDGDSGTNAALTYAIATVNGGAATTPFTIDASTGVVTLTTFDFESQTSYSILFRVSDGGTPSLTTTATVNVDITDVNEHTPVFALDPYSFTVSETTAIGTTVFSVAATDADTADVLSYSFNPASSYFQINPSTGSVVTTAAINYDTLGTNPIVEVIFAVDNGASPAFKTGSTTVSVTVTDDNDVTPVFSPAVYTASVAENEVAGYTVTTVTAVDVDDASLTFSLVNGFSVFKIDSSAAKEGVITIDTANQDYDSATKSYIIVVHAVDAGSNTGSTSVYVTLTNINEATPVLAPTAAAVNLPENSAVDTLIVDVDATDTDEGVDGDITYSIATVTTGYDGVFSIDPSTGLLSVAANIDMEVVTNPITVTVDATDAGTNPSAFSSQFTLTLTITDVNDNTPSCTSSLYSVSMGEDTAAGTSVAQMTCSDSDTDTANNVLQYSISSGNADGKFAIDGSSGEVTTAVAATLDREITASYTLVIQVADTGTSVLSTSTTLAITVTDVNDNDPAFVASPYAFSLLEDSSVGDAVGTVAATDADSGQAGAVSYSINSGNTDSNLAIDGTTGEIKLVGVLNYEQTQSYTLEILAIDNLAPFRTTTGAVTISVNDVNDVVPSCTPLLQTVLISENTATSTSIATISCSDADSTPLSYTISTVDGITTTTPFNLDANTGEVTLATLLDYETDTLKTVIVHVIDAVTSGLTGTATLNVVVTDVNEANPAFTGTPYATTVIESSAIGSTVFTVAATDADTADSLTYSLAAASTVFNIDSTTGEILLISALDYETTPSYTISVVATDNGAVTALRSTTIAVTISVTDANDGVPVFNPAVYTGTIAENNPTGTTVATVTVTDVDTPSLTYTIVSGNSDAVFRIETSGVVLIDSVTNLDYDSSVKNYPLIVTADDGTNTATTTVQVVVTNINDNTPVFAVASSTQSVAEDSVLNTAIVTVAATDGDHGDDGVITYSIVSGNTDGKFAINPTSGAVTLAGSLDMETTSAYTVTITATDAGTNPGALTAQYVLTVSVTDVNDFSPVCTAAPYTATIAENSATSTSVAQLTCTDSDSTAANNVVSLYNIVSGNTGAAFTISNSGEVTTSTALDRETLASYTLLIDVIDSGSSPLTTTATLSITVTDFNDGTPTYVTNPYHVTTAEDASIGTSLLTVIATDTDSGDAGTVTYSITAGNGAGKFEVDHSSGEIKVVDNLDFETITGPYVLEVEAVDGDGTTKLTGTTTLSLTVTDVNDNTPSCTPVLHSVSFAEDLASSSTVASLTCSDADTTPNSDLTYTIVSVNGVAVTTPFSVDALGVVTLATASSFDYETTTSYRVLVRINDGGTSSLSFTATVNVAITDVNEFTPTFQSTPYTFNVIETTAVGTSVFAVVATDGDTGDTVEYTISPANTYFEIDGSSGVISTIQLIDFDSLVVKTIAVSVVATDSSATAKSATETVTFTITNDNDGTPTFNPGVYIASVAESSVVGDTVSTVTVTDVDDTSWTLSFASGNTANVFRIEANGDIIIDDVTNFDYDTADQNFVLVAKAVDAGSNTGTATVYVTVTNVNDNAPSFTASASTETVAENTVSGTTIIDLDANDADSGTDGDITYTITSVTNSGTGKFSVDPDSGVVTVAGTLDMETVTSYVVVVEAKDAGITPSFSSDTYTLTVTITDQNDNTPACSQSVYVANVAEDVANPTSVVTLSCPDADTNAPNNVVSSFAITGGNTGTAFAISPSGEITTAAALDRETLDNYLLVIEVTDSGTTPSALTATTSVSITVTDVNDNAPAFAIATYNFNQGENIAIGMTVGTVAATDQDIDIAGLIVYSIASGDVDSKFTVDSSSGELKLTAALDFETATINPYTIVINAVDSDTGTPLTGITTVIFTINDYNDNTPSCTPAFDTITFDEDTALTTTLKSLACSDQDSSLNAALTYTITSVNAVTGTGSFSIDTSGAIRLTLAMDYETVQLYEILVEVNDGGTPSLTSTVQVNLVVTDVNDNVPVFTSTPYSTNVAENTVVGTTVFTVTAGDLDTGDTIIFSVSPAVAEFNIDSSTGEIILAAAVDFDTTPTSYEVIVLATDSGTNPSASSSSATVSITITNANDGTPVFSPNVYATSVIENSANGITVIAVTVSDIDDTTFTYNIASGNTDNIFGIAGTTTTADVTITDNTLLDFETTTSYTLVIQATDPGGLIGSATVQIEITNYNEHTPSFASSSSTQTVAENSATGTSVVQVAATDGDSGSDGVIKYAITSGASGKFAIDPSTGEVTVSGSLDVETVGSYTVVIDAVDGGTIALTSQYTLTVTVTDVNDFAPVCSSSLYSANLAEDAASGTSVSQLNCPDADSSAPNNNVATYAITAGNTGGEFLISATGEVTTAAVMFDRETTDSYEIVIVVTDSGTTPSAMSTTTTLTITVTDVNDNDPVFGQPIYNIIINENTARHTSIGAVTATDLDIDLAGSLVYSIFSGNGDGKFLLDSTTGDITLAATVDYETTTTTPYILTVHATDKEVVLRTGTSTVSITLVDVNDNSPSCTRSLYTGEIAENVASGTSVATVVCTDADTVGSITYTFTPSVSEFNIDANTGVITTAATLDIETTPSYALTVVASDGTLATTVTVTVGLTDVNDNTPVFSPAGPYTQTINENESVGYTVKDINAIDSDVTETTFIYTIASGNDDGKFVISVSSGIIQLQQTIDRDSPLMTSYTLTIEVSDGTTTATTSIVVTIDDLNDNYPSCDSSSYSVTKLESTVSGTSLISPVCTDLDIAASPTPLLYTITAGNGDGKFQVNTGTGELTTQANLDYETTTSYTLTVTVDDQGTSSNLVLTITMTIYVDPVNEHTPVLQNTPYDVTVNEAENFGYLVVTVSATDMDTGSNHGVLRYAISSGNSAGHFSIDSTSGAITVSGPLDRESISSYSITVGASDMLEGESGALTAQTTFVITISDSNDNYPQISPSTYAVTVNENAGMGASIVQIIATDDDDGTAGTSGLQYDITAGNTLTAFTINGNWVEVLGNIDAATQSTYVLTVKVSDQGTPVLSSFTLVTIEVVAINEHSPTFSVLSTTVTLSESETVGNSIYQAAASDLDLGDFAVLRYNLVSGITNSEFSVDPFNGDVRVTNKLDYDTNPIQYSLVIEVRDTATSTADTNTATMTVTVDLTDANDETPTFTLNIYTASIDENESTGTSVVTVTATDADSSSNGAVTYSIVSGTGVSSFSIHSTSGVISTSAGLDYETLAYYDVTVKAVDSGTVPLSSTCVVQITVVDLNDNTPVFQVAALAISITEATAINTVIATVQAIDADSIASNNNAFIYSFSVVSSDFSIDATSGAITTIALLDRDTVPSHTLVIYAKDQLGSGASVLTGTATYTVQLTDENDNAPAYSNLPYDTTIAEDTIINTVVFTITATDLDANENAVLTYSITSGDANNDFVIDSGSGLIQVKKSLDRETIDSYNLQVTVVDNGAPPQSAITVATVTISDVNDNSPIFQPYPTTSYTFSVVENVPSGTSVDSVSATDADTGTNAVITFVISSFVTGDNTHFVIDASTGVISTAGSLDREVQDTYEFIVRASDGSPNVLTASATVTISITDYNDNIPSFSSTLYTGNVVENTIAGTSILSVVITDVDINVNDDITLSIDLSTPDGPRADIYIALDSATSIISVKTPIDRETDQSFSFTLIATDGGTPALSFTTSVSITVGDENDNLPVFSPTFYNSEIAYNDDCQVTVATITATDADTGVNAVLSYSTTLNNNPHLFTLDSSTGDVTLVATAGTDTGYVLYAAATDMGSPASTSSTGATVRVDTYNPTTTILNYYMSISSATYLASEATFLSQLTTVYQQTYTSAEAKRWCVAAITSVSCVVRVYVVKDTTAVDEESEITVTKTFLTVDQAYAVTAQDDAGTPASVIQGIGWTSFAITRVEKYYDPPDDSSTPWIQSDAGIITMSVIGFVVLVSGILFVALIVYKCRHPAHNPRNRVEIGEDDGGDSVAKNQYKKNTSMHRIRSGNENTRHAPAVENDWKRSVDGSVRNHSALQKFDGDPPPEDFIDRMFLQETRANPVITPIMQPYNKSHLPPAVVALPVPSATKKVPMQVGNKSIEKSKDTNLLANQTNGPTLMKKPEKLRVGSPIPTENVVAPHHLTPARKPSTVKPFVQADPSNGPTGPGDNQHYNVKNREINGRAIDPVTGRLYEYNTLTGERRWVTDSQGKDVKLSREEA